jgi:predicted HTH transcriptional regulator
MYRQKPKTITITMDNNSLLKLLDSNLANFLLIVIKQTNKLDYKWYSTKSNRSQLQNKLELSSPTISRYIATLKAKDILIQGEFSARGEYILNKKIITL